jgi:hypothetical protein
MWNDFKGQSKGQIYNSKTNCDGFENKNDEQKFLSNYKICFLLILREGFFC